MRKIDRKLNLQKVNILTEQRYLESKGILKEEIELQRGDEIVWVGAPRVIDKNLTVKPGQKGEYIGRETSGEWVVEFSPFRFHANDFEFERANNIRNNQGMNNVSDMINHIKSQGGLQEGSEGFDSVRLVNKNDFNIFIK